MPIMPDQTQKNSIDLAVLKESFTNLDKKFDKALDWLERHDLKDDDRHEKVEGRFDTQHDEIDEIKKMIGSIVTQQAVEKVKLGIIIGGIVLIAKEVIVFVSNKLF